MEFEEGQAVKVEVKDGKLYINDKVQNLEIDSKVIKVENGNNSYSMTVDGTNYVLPKYSAASGLTSLKFEDQNTTSPSKDESKAIRWILAATDKLNWKVTRDINGVKRNDLLVGQMSSKYTGHSCIFQFG